MSKLIAAPAVSKPTQEISQEGEEEESSSSSSSSSLGGTSSIVELSEEANMPVLASMAMLEKAQGGINNGVKTKEKQGSLMELRGSSLMDSASPNEINFLHRRKVVAATQRLKNETLTVTKELTTGQYLPPVILDAATLNQQRNQAST